jgi:hypothetical protein
MVRSIAAFFVGMIMAVVMIIICQTINMGIYPLPEGLSPENPEALAAYVANAPVGAMVGVLFSYFFGSFAGGAVATRLAKNSTAGLCVGGALMLAGFKNLADIPHPLWFAIASTLIYLPTAWLGSRLAMGRIKSDEGAV